MGRNAPCIGKIDSLEEMVEEMKQYFKKKVGTIVYYHEEYPIVEVFYRDTCIFRYEPTYNLIVFDTGGWFTTTTKQRMNDAIRFIERYLGNDLPGVYQKKRVWYLGDKEWEGSCMFFTYLPTLKEEENKA